MKNKKSIKEFENFSQRNYKKIMKKKHNSELLLDKPSNSDDMQRTNTLDNYIENINKTIGRCVLVEPTDSIIGLSKELNEIDVVDLSIYTLDILDGNFLNLININDVSQNFSMKEFEILKNMANSIADPDYKELIENIINSLKLKLDET
jgi:hypothetical protein